MIYNKDCVIGAKDIDDESIDLLICDPPFGNELNMVSFYRRKNNPVIPVYKEAPDDPELYYQWSKEWLTEAYRILKSNGSIYVVSGWTNAHRVARAAEEVGFHIRNKIIWHYKFCATTKLKYTTSHYEIFYLCKNTKACPTFNRRYRSSDRLYYSDIHDVWNISKVFDRGNIEKNKNKLPDALVAKMIKISSNEDDLVCDFFLGNFTTAIVAERMNRECCGFEINEESFKRGMKKILQINKLF